MKYMSERMFFVSILSKAKAMASSRSFKQTLAVSGSNIFIMGLGFVINILLAREMGVEDFGIFSFAFAVFSFVALFMEFGFYSTAAKILADTNDSVTERKLLGGIFVTYIIINTIFAIFMYVVGIYIDDFFPDKIGYIVRMMAFSGYAYTAPFFMEWVLKGCNKIYLLSQYSLIGKLLYFTEIIVLWYVELLAPITVLYSYAFAYGIAILWCYMRLRPIFVITRELISSIYESNKLYGFPQYIGRIVDVGSANIDRMLISYFVNASTLGLYSLAVSFVSVVSVLGKSIGITKFKAFANEKNISITVLYYTKIGTIISACVVLVVSYISIYYILNIDYHDTFIYVLLLILGAMAQSIYRIYIDWISGHGFSQDLRNAALSISIVNIIAVFSLTGLIGIYGTCIAVTLGYAFSLYKYIKIYRFYSEG